MSEDCGQARETVTHGRGGQALRAWPVGFLSAQQTYGGREEGGTPADVSWWVRPDAVSPGKRGESGDGWWRAAQCQRQRGRSRSDSGEGGGADAVEMTRVDELRGAALALEARG